MALTLRRFLGLAVLLAAAGCPKAVILPVANAGSNVKVNTGSVVRLDGSSSCGQGAAATTCTDSQGRPLTFTWSFVSMPSGSAAQLNDAHSVTPSFVADVPGDYVVQLLVANAFLASAPATVKVTADTCGSNVPTTGALSSSPALPGVGQVVLLSASAHDADNDSGCALGQALTYSWRMISQPASSAATLNNAGAVTPSFTPDVPGDYSFRLVVTDSTNRASAPSDFTVTASLCGFNRPVIPGLSSNGSLGVGSNVQLLSGPIVDADNSAACGPTAAGLGVTFSYAWQVLSLPQGSHAALNSSTSNSPSFVPDIAGSYSFSLIVTSSNGRASDPKTISLSVGACGGQFPVATINPQTPASPVIGSTIQLSAIASDPDQTSCTPSIPQPLTYAWALAATPIGSQAILNNPTSTNPSFVADVSGTYTVQLAVTDPQGHRTLASALSFLVSNCGASAPIIDKANTGGSYAPAQAVIGTARHHTTVTVSTPVVAPDNDSAGCGLHETLSYSWSMTTRPPGSNAVIANPTLTGVTTLADGTSTASAQFDADVPNATYQLQLIATASNGKTGAPKYFNVSTNACGSQAPSVSASATSTLAGFPAVFNIGVPVKLAATPTDPDNDPAATPLCSLGQALAVTWTVVSRPATSGAALATPNPGATALYTTTLTPDAVGTYQFSVVASDDTGLSSAPAFVSFTTTACGTAAPVASVSANGSAPGPNAAITVAPQTVLNLDAAASTWLATQAYAVNALVKPVLGASGGVVFRVTTAGTSGASEPAWPTTAGVTVTSGTAIFTAVAANQVLVTTTDADRLGTCGLPDPATVLWSIVTRPTTSKAIITDPTSASLTYTPDAPGDYKLQVVATDSTHLTSAPAFVNLTVTSCSLIPPAVNAVFLNGSATGGTGATTFNLQALTIPAVFTPAGGGSAPGFTDANCLSTGISAYQWSLVSKPAGSGAVLLNPTSASTTFTPDKVGTYQASVVITDSQNISSAPFFQNFSIIDCSSATAMDFLRTNPALPPIAISWIDPDPSNASYQTVLNAGAQVKLIANVADQNAATCGGAASTLPYSYQWALVSVPAGSRAQLTTPTGPTPSFVPDVPGDYQVSAIVTDALGNSTPTQFKVISTSLCGRNLPKIGSLSAGGAVNSYSAVMLTATVTDDDSDPSKCPARFKTALTPAWSIATQPPTGRATLSTTTGSNSISGITLISQTTFEAFSAGSYGVLFSVAAGTGFSNSQVVTFSASSCGSNPPAISGATTAAAPAGTPWAPTRTYGLGAVVLPTAANGFEFKATAISTGTSGATQPAWPTTAGATIVDGGVTWTAVAFSQGSRPRAGLDTVQIAATATDADFVCASKTIANFTWNVVSLPSGSGVTVAPANITQSAVSPFATSTFQFNPDVAGTYLFSVTATDSTGLASPPVQLTVQTAVCSPSFAGLQYSDGTATNPPGIVIGGTATVRPSSPVTDLCVNPATLTFGWSLSSKPATSAVTLPSGSNASGTGSVAFVPDVPGQYQVTLVVSDQGGFSSAPVVQTIRANSCGSNPPSIANRSLTITTPFLVNNSGGTEIAPPLAGKINIGDVVSIAVPNILDGGTSNPNPVCTTAQVQPYSYSWALISAPNGSRAQLSSTMAAAPSLKADVPGAYVVSASVTDALGNASAPAFLSIQTSNCGANFPLPYIQAGGVTVAAALGIPGAVTGAVSNTLTAVQSNAAVGLTALAYDADADTSVCPASFNTPAIVFADGWSISSRTTGASSSITNTLGATTAFTPQNAGTSKVALSVTSSNGFRSAPLELPITSTACGSSIPQITGTVVMQGGSASSRPLVGTAVALSAIPFDQDTATGSTTCTTPLSAAGAFFTWTLVSGPAGNTATASGTAPVAGFFSFTPNVAGTYVYNVTVTYPVTGLTSAPTTVTIPTGTCGPNLASISEALGDPSLTASSQAGFRVDLLANATSGALSSACVTPTTSPLSYAWSFLSKPAGSGTAFTNPSGAAPSFTPDLPGSYQVQLVLTDIGGNSTIATNTFNIGGCTSSPSLTATAGTGVINWSATSPDGTTTLPNAQVNRGDRVQLSIPAANIIRGTCGTANNASFTYQWAMVGRPAGSSASLSSSTDAQPVFIPDVANGAYLFLVTVRDALGNSVTLSGPQAVGKNRTGTVVGVSDCGVRVPAAPAITPSITNANSFQSVTLTAAGVADPEQAASANFTACPARFFNTAYGYSWKSTPSANATLGAMAATTTFFANQAGSYTVSLAVAGSTDGVPSASSSTVLLTVNQCGSNPPIAGGFSASQTFLDGATVSNASGATTLANNLPVQVAVAVTDADSTPACTTVSATSTGVLPANDGFTLQWTLTSPPGSKATLTNATSIKPSFTPDLQGLYTLSEVATDANGNSDTRTFTVTTNACGTLVPTVGSLTAQQVVNGAAVVFNPALPQYMDLGLPIQLAANPAVADVNSACGGHPVATTSYAWKFLALPPGSAAAMLGAATASASFVPDVMTTVPTAPAPTFYTVQLVATDSLGHSSSSNALAITAICGAAAPRLNPETPTSGSFWASQTVALASSTLTITHSSVSTDTTAPHAEAFGNVSFYQGAPVQLFTSNSDNDAPFGCGAVFPTETTFYAWTLVNLPSGSTATLNNAGAANPSFVPDVPGDYDLQLVLSDSGGKSSGPIALGTMSSGATLPIPNPSATGATVGVTTHVIHVESCGGGTPTAKLVVGSPVAAASGATGVGQPFTGATSVTVDASQSTSTDSVPLNTGVSPATGCGLSRPLSYKWSYTSLPVASGTSISFTDSALVSPVLSLNVAGSYGLALDVSSGGKTSRATTTLGAATAKSFVGVAGTTHALYTAIATDPTSGNPVVAFLDGDTGQIHVQRCTSGCATGSPTWSGSSIPDVDVLGLNPAITPALDEDPRPLDMKVGADGTIFVAYGTGPGAPGGGRSACSAYLAAFLPTATNWTYAPVKTAVISPPPFGGTVGCSNNDTFTGSNFSNPTLVAQILFASATQEGRWLSLALDPNSSQPRVVVEDQAATLSCFAPGGSFCSPPPTSPSGRTPLYATCSLVGAALSCAAPSSIAVPGSALSGRWPSLKIDGSGFADVAFFVDSAGTGFAANSLAYTTSSSGFVPVQVDAATDVGRFASLDLARPKMLGNNTTSYAPRIAYLDKTNGAVKLASIVDGSSAFTKTVVDTGVDPTNLGEAIALAIDPASGSPRIAYRASGNLKFASSASLTSNFQFLTPTATGGPSISMALTPLGGFRISYQGSSATQLEVQAIGQ